MSRFMIAIAAALILLVASCAPPPDIAPDISAVLATVGQVRITRVEVQRMMASMDRPELSRSQLQQEAIEQLIAQELLYQEARRREIEVAENEISGHLDLLRQEFLSRDTFEDSKRENGLDDEKLRQQTHRKLTIARLLDEEVYAKTAIGDAEMVKTPRQVHELYIYRKVYPGAPRAKRQEAWRKMQEALDRLKAGADFSRVAEDYSQSGLAKYGGDAGFITLNPNSQVCKALFALGEGQISEIIETRWGLFILQAQEIRPEMMRVYAELSPKLKRIVLQQRMQRRLDEFVEELRRNTDVQIVS